MRHSRTKVRTQRSRVAPRHAVPLPVIERLAKYYLFTQDKVAEGVDFLSSDRIARALGITCSTVRRDLSYVALCGKANVGYETKCLTGALCERLGARRTTNLAIVGAGNMGKALLRHQGFRRHGFSIRAIFDNDPSIVGRTIGPLVVSSIRSLPRIVKARRIDIGVIAVPEACAQEVADALTLSGIKGLLNLSEVPIRVPPGVRVLDVRIVARLLELVCQVKSV